MDIVRIRIADGEVVLTKCQLEILYILDDARIERRRGLTAHEIAEHIERELLYPEIAVRSSLLPLIRKGLVSIRKRGRLRYMITDKGVKVIKEARFWGIR